MWKLFQIGMIACLLATGLVSVTAEVASGFADEVAMDIERLKQLAFTRCQSPFKAPVIEPVPMLDPPQVGGASAEGMVYQEELAVKTSNLLDHDGFYFSPRPRAAVNSLPLEIFVENSDRGIYRRKTWEDANPDYSSGAIQPPIDKSKIPPAGRILTELIIGHRSPQGDYPQLFDLRSSAYVRFAGYPPQVTGASLRLGAHRIFDQVGAQQPAAKEDYPIIRAIFASVRSPKTAHIFLLIENGLSCSALSVELSEGENAELLVDSYWYGREDFHWEKDPHTALVAYSSMLWKTEKDTPERSTDEAHDSDTLRIKYTNSKEEKYVLEPPSDKLRVRDLTEKKGAPKLSEWTLANEDRDPSHYADFAPALGNTNYHLRASYNVTILESNIKTGLMLYEQTADGEYGDNIVVASTIRQDIKKADSVEKFVRFKYRTTAFFPD